MSSGDENSTDVDRLKSMTRPLNGQAKQRAERRAAGRCVDCGGPEPEPGKQRCAACLGRDRNRIARRRAERQKAGRCVNCDRQPPVPGLQTCDDCRAIRRERPPPDERRPGGATRARVPAGGRRRA